jgi:hypothetical protein
MFKPFAKVVKGIDKLSDVAKSLEEIERQSVMVGIPEQRASRGSEEVNNAELGYVLAHGVRRGEVRRFVKDAQKQGQTYSEAMQAYIMAHGDPLWHIPPRPFLEPAIEHNKENLGTQQGKVLKKALEGKRDQAKTEFRNGSPTQPTTGRLTPPPLLNARVVTALWWIQGSCMPLLTT